MGDTVRGCITDTLDIGYHGDKILVGLIGYGCITDKLFAVLPKKKRGIFIVKFRRKTYQRFAS